MVSKLDILLIMNNKLVDFLQKPVVEFFNFLKKNEHFKQSISLNLFYKPTDSLGNIIEKLIFSQGQIFHLNENRNIVGSIIIHDIIINYEG